MKIHRRARYFVWGKKNLNKRKKGEGSCDTSEQLRGTAAGLLSQFFFPMSMKCLPDRNELFSGLFAILCQDVSSNNLEGINEVKAIYLNHVATTPMHPQVTKVMATIT